MAKYVEETHPVDDQNLSFFQHLEQPVDLNILLEDRQSSEIYNGEIGSFEEFDKEAFIEAVRKLRCLWDTNDKSYKDRDMMVNPWRQLSSVFEKDGEC